MLSVPYVVPEAVLTMFVANEDAAVKAMLQFGSVATPAPLPESTL